MVSLGTFRDFSQFLRTSRIDFCRFKGWVYLELGNFDVPVDFFSFLVVDIVVLNVTLLFLDINGWKLGKIVRDLEQNQKGISYLLVVHERSFSRHTRKRNAYLFVVVFPTSHPYSFLPNPRSKKSFYHSYGH